MRSEEAACSGNFSAAKAGTNGSKAGITAIPPERKKFLLLIDDIAMLIY
jgi:hypothetical protein